MAIPRRRISQPSEGVEADAKLDAFQDANPEQRFANRVGLDVLPPRERVSSFQLHAPRCDRDRALGEVGAVGDERLRALGARSATGHRRQEAEQGEQGEGNTYV